MNTPRNCLSIAFVLMLILAGDIDCGRDANRMSMLSKAGRFRDIAQAVNFLKENLHPNMAFEEQCKRYAVLSDISLAVKFPYKKTLLEVATMELDVLNEQYDQLGIERISYGYMSVIDRYRVTKLAPPILDLIECLKKIDRPTVRTYLANEELNIIIDLYKQVLEQPEKEIAAGNVNLKRLRPVFRNKLRNLFSDYCDIDKILGIPSSSSQNPIHPSSKSESSSAEAQSIEQSRESELEKQSSLERRREMARLKQYRRRVLYPELRLRDRIYQEERRELMKIQRWEPVMKPDESEIKRRKKEARDQRNMRRRLRYRQLRELEAEYQQFPKPAQVDPLHVQFPEQGLTSQLLQESRHQQLTPFTPEEQVARQEQRFSQSRPLVNPMTSFPRLSQSQGSQEPYSSSLPSSFLEVHRALISKNKHDRDVLFDYQPPHLDDRPVGREALVERTGPQDSNEDKFDAVAQYLSDEPQSSEATVDKSASISIKDRSSGFGSDQSN